MIAALVIVHYVLAAQHRIVLLGSAVWLCGGDDGVVNEVLLCVVDDLPHAKRWVASHHFFESSRSKASLAVLLESEHLVHFGISGCVIEYGSLVDDVVRVGGVVGHYLNRCAGPLPQRVKCVNVLG